MKYLLIFALTTLAQVSYAGEATCKVKGMHCSGCKEMVEGKLCDEAKYSTCDVKILDAKKEIGQLHLVTKDKMAQVDQKSVDAVIVDAGYKLEKCETKKN